MPISSGAEGHVGVGVDRSIKWIPEGGEDHEEVRISNSYLQRYLYHTGCGKKKSDEKTESSDNDGIRNTQNKLATTKESSNVHSMEQRRKKYNKAQDGKIQDGPLKENHSTTNTQENSTKATKEDSGMPPSKKPMTSTTGPKQKDLASTNGPAKKSSVCLIL